MEEAILTLPSRYSLQYRTMANTSRFLLLCKHIMWSLMKTRKRVGDRTKPWGTPLLIGLGEKQWLCKTPAIERPASLVQCNTKKWDNLKACIRAKYHQVKHHIAWYACTRDKPTWISNEHLVKSVSDLAHKVVVSVKDVVACLLLHDGQDLLHILFC